jgi:hypothetical protein
VTGPLRDLPSVKIITRSGFSDAPEEIRRHCETIVNDRGDSDGASTP